MAQTWWDHCWVLSEAMLRIQEIFQAPVNEIFHEFLSLKTPKRWLGEPPNSAA